MPAPDGRLVPRPRARYNLAVKIGINLPVMVPGLDRATVLEWCRRVDAGAFSTLAVGERITFPNPEALVAMSVAAAVTERVQLAFTVLVSPLHAPLVLAKQMATLDVLSGGRLIVGLGVGAREDDYRAAGAPFDGKRLGRLEADAALMRRAWAGERVVEGAHPIEPRPLQPGGPKIWAGSLLPQSIRRAARWADGICGFSFAPSADEIALQFEGARVAWRDQGRAQPPRLVTSFWFALGAEADRRMDEYLRRYLGFFGDHDAEQLRAMCQVRSAPALRDAVKMVRDLGADELLLVPTTSDPDELSRLEDALA